MKISRNYFLQDLFVKKWMFFLFGFNCSLILVHDLSLRCLSLYLKYHIVEYPSFKAQIFFLRLIPTETLIDRGVKSGVSKYVSSLKDFVCLEFYTNTEYISIRLYQSNISFSPFSTGTLINRENSNQNGNNKFHAIKILRRRSPCILSQVLSEYTE